ncbi:hypothetical protein A0J61_10799, partial [Choanephora cucurbitarum]
MIQIAVCPGKPKNLISFLQSVIAEVNSLYEKGLIIKKQGIERFNSNVAILGVTGDIPGIAELISFAGHTHTYGCRICLVKASDPAPGCIHGKHFPSVGNERTIESLKVGDIAKGMNDVPELLTSLPTFMGASSFFEDELHMTDHGLGHSVCNLLGPKANSHFRVKNSSNYSFDFIQPNFFQTLSEWISKTRRRLMMRVWTMNYHFASYHIYELIKRYGPLRYYSCRSLERTIPRYVNLSRSKSAPDVETSNILQRYNYFKTYNSILNQNGLVRARRTREAEYEDDPDDEEGVLSQLWKKFQQAVLNDGIEIANVSIIGIRQAMEKYFGRLSGGSTSLDNNSVKWAARVMIDGIVIQSRWHRGNQKNVKRADNLVIFE